MRIQNNIMALNTQRQYTINNDNVAKSAEKLSSGYRINRAGDDAAGLAISEKMRSQIRGLNMATRNSQDAISLVQTAEGALQETHSMLQRMNELANQSATGTNQTLDRNAIAKEFDQLKREINDVAEQTTFNNMKILDGSLSYSGPQRSAATAGIYASTTTTPTVNGAVTSAVTTAGSAGTKATFEIDLAGAAIANADAAGTDTFKITIGGQDMTTGALAAGAHSDTALATAFNGKTITIGATTYTAATNGTKLTFTAAAVGTQAAANLPTDGTAFTGAVTGTGTATAATTATTAGRVDGTAAQAEVTTSKVDVTKLKAGDTLTVGDKTYSIIEDGGTAAAGTAGIELAADGTITLANLVAGINADAPTDVTVAATADGFTVTQDAGSEGVSDTDVTFAAAGNSKTTVEFDTVKLKDGDQIKVSVGGADYSYTFKEGDSVKDIAAGLVDAGGNAIAADVKSSAILVDGTATVAFTGANLGNNFDAIRIQVGALEGEQLSVSIDSMNTAGLGLDGIGVSTQETAGKAITATRAAIDKVSDQRAALGSMQNRLEHKIANLKVSSENLSAAESRIRDVDIASEMTQFTKNNILSQASTAMLAQANSLPQNVLSLLR